MSTPDQMEEQLFQALRAIQLQMGRLPFEELKARFTDVGDRLAPQFSSEGHPELAVQVHRRVAENILGAALDARRPAEECEQLLEDMIALGFESLHHRAQIVTMVCGHFSHEPGHEALLNRHLIPLCADLTDALQSQDDATHRFHLDNCRDILARQGSNQLSTRDT